MTELFDQILCGKCCEPIKLRINAQGDSEGFCAVCGQHDYMNEVLTQTTDQVVLELIESKFIREESAPDVAVADVPQRVQRWVYVSASIRNTSRA